MKNTIKHIAFLYGVSILIACGEASKYLDMVNSLPVYNTASNVDKRSLSNESTQQLFFLVEKPYPSNDVLEYYQKYFVDHNWKKCTSTMNSWNSYLDKSGSVDMLVHEAAYHWIKKDERKFSMISLRYLSEWKGEYTDPDNETQRITVLMQKNVNLDEELSLLAVSCD